ncbi:tripartite tricarboxylate transporter substrate binding protein [Bordetella bronchiseptica]|uniref:tripartite tricarboxylate transporter substrate binding protein n=1 Tax=Bordetella bronchiseptica TaxID=518 RepID=UPI000461516C|nr:tripartite tricarboxylate transporter substrate binding protein [Bordetella bronchiseptica]KDD42483.1 tripartite tricarboxylate transporter family receptor [Bordetella bronchiseptica MBORD901]
MNRTLRSRAFVRCALGAMLALLPPWAAAAQDYPDKARPVRIIVPSGAGSIVDLLARAQAKAMSEVAGINVVVENKPGAETIIGVQALMAAPPDGYTMLVTSSSSQSINPVMLPNLPYNPLEDYVPLEAISTSPLYMNLGASTRFGSAGDFIAAARANPGKYTCASATTATRLACAQLEGTTGIEMLNVPYRTSASALTAVASGEADVFFIDIGSARAFWQAGKMRPVAVTSSARAKALPQVPTLREQGAANYEFVAWFAAYFPARTLPQTVAKMREILQAAYGTPGFVEALATYGHEPLQLAGADLLELNRKEIAKWSTLVKEGGIQVQ